jgi:hypothetical protein
MVTSANIDGCHEHSSYAEKFHLQTSNTWITHFFTVLKFLNTQANDSYMFLLSFTLITSL